MSDFWTNIAGYKTYLLSAVATVAAIVLFGLGKIDAGQLTMILTLTGAASTLRHGMTTEANK